MSFFTNAIDVLQTLVIALGGGPGRNFSLIIAPIL